MSITNTKISDDIAKDDNKLSFSVQNIFDYQFDPLKDAYIDGYGGKPAGVVTGNVGQLKLSLRSGYVLKKVGSENITVEVFLDGATSPFHTKVITREYYIQTLNQSDGGGRGGGTNDGGDDGIVDTITDVSDFGGGGLIAL